MNTRVIFDVDDVMCRVGLCVLQREMSRNGIQL